VVKLQAEIALVDAELGRMKPQQVWDRVRVIFVSVIFIFYFLENLFNKLKKNLIIGFNPYSNPNLYRKHRFQVFSMELQRFDSQLMLLGTCWRTINQNQ
jgi:hypothetical protein